MPYKGGRRKKSRTHRVPGPGAGVDKPPAAFVLRRGKVSLSDKRRILSIKPIL